ncbi:hypothetical protein [Geothrix sp. PMB-07]|uniref:hypothetical protein n=1 Tax=Geothrix sp. PMB-07 TaxID=3068640 RepID=UPI00274165DE|nr:hypothetical protein [Geothrix sp. PMB-07]WLT32220.1 hypothetical protein Q9293_02585 [Geothrix sp. PMB-07]
MSSSHIRSMARGGVSILLLATPLLADGIEAAAAVAVGPTQRNAIPHSGDHTTALQLRVGWDQSPSQLRMDQWQVMAQSGSSETVQFVMTGLGAQRSWWTERHGAQAALGAELRLERYTGHSSLAGGTSPLASAQAWMVRPWLRAQAGFRGLLIPLPSPAMEALHWLTQGGRYTHPFTRIEVAVPLWQQGGEGPRGALRQMAPRWEGSVQLGMRFGGSL